MDTINPDMFRMPSLDFTNTSGTNNSSFASGLTTPTDEQAIGVDITPCEDAQNIEDPATPRPKYTIITAAEDVTPSESKRTIRRAVTKARSMVKMVITSPKKLRKRRAVDLYTDPEAHARATSSGNVAIEVEVETRAACELSVVSQEKADVTVEFLATSTASRPVTPLSPLPDVEITTLRVLDTIFYRSEPLTVRACVGFATLAVLLPFYSVLVGACILVAPAYLNAVAFGRGYYFKHPPQAAARVSHWAYCAWPHIFTFLAAVTCLILWKRSLGISIAALAITGTLIAWSDFKLDKSIPLGTDDRQTIFMVVTEGIISDGYCIEANGTLYVIQDAVDMSTKDFL